MQQFRYLFRMNHRDSNWRHWHWSRPKVRTQTKPRKHFKGVLSIRCSSFFNLFVLSFDTNDRHHQRRWYSRLSKTDRTTGWKGSSPGLHNHCCSLNDRVLFFVTFFIIDIVIRPSPCSNRVPSLPKSSLSRKNLDDHVMTSKEVSIFWDHKTTITTSVEAFLVSTHYPAEIFKPPGHTRCRWRQFHQHPERVLSVRWLRRLRSAPRISRAKDQNDANKKTSSLNCRPSTSDIATSFQWRCTHSRPSTPSRDTAHHWRTATRHNNLWCDRDDETIHEPADVLEIVPLPLSDVLLVSNRRRTSSRSLHAPDLAHEHSR